jgi:hypothetical protein
MDIALSDLALDGGRAANAWQKRHAKLKAAEAKKKLRAVVRAEAKADLRKRTKKWRSQLMAKAAANKAAGLPPPSRHGRPRDVRRNFLDMTGWRFGRLTVLRVAPVSKNGAQRCRTWWVKCDCGSPERRVNGTTLRQGNTKSCGCLVRERLSQYFKKRRAEREVFKAAPLSIKLADLRSRIIHGKRVTRQDSKMLGAVWKAIVEVEVNAGIRRRYKSGRAMLLVPAGVPSRTRRKPVLKFKRLH